MNTIKTFLLMFGMTLIIMFIGNAMGGQNGVVYAFIFAAIMNFTSYWFSDKIVLSMYKAKEVDTNSQLYALVERVAKSADLPMPKVYIIEENQPNAFATGRNPRNAAVAVTTGILQILDENELSGVIGHELGHVHNRDILIGTVAATLAGAIMMLSNMARWASMFGGRGRDDRDGGNPLALLIVALLAPIAATLLQMAISRTREYKADAFGAKVSGNPMFLASALRKLELGASRIPMDASPTTENMFIVSPFSGGARFSRLFSTHPATADRIAKLEEMRNSGVQI